LRRQVGPLYEVFLGVKRLLDPQNLLNPGKIVGHELELPFSNLRPALQVRSDRPEPAMADAVDVAPAATANGQTADAGPDMLPAPQPTDELIDQPGQLRNLVELQLNWHPERLVDAAADCNRCGECRTQAGPERMCPIFRFAPAEEASPRAKANLVRGLLTGEIPLTRLSSEPLKQVLDLCVHCHSCRLECPARVDIPRLASQSKASYVTANGLSWSQWITTRAELLVELASLCRPAANWALANPWVRWVMEKLVGIEHQRKLPRLAKMSFLRWAAKRKLTRPTKKPGPKEAYYVDL
jgi:ferredoxin